MPTISRFYGITIMMFYRDHSPPHFHAEYGEHEAVVGISPVGLMHGSLPSRARSMVLEWAAQHQKELMADWESCRAGAAPKPIDPLE
jgi:hypothetical protein